MAKALVSINSEQEWLRPWSRSIPWWQALAWDNKCSPPPGNVSQISPTSEMWAAHSFRMQFICDIVVCPEKHNGRKFNFLSVSDLKVWPPWNVYPTQPGRRSRPTCSESVGEDENTCGSASASPASVNALVLLDPSRPEEELRGIIPGTISWKFGKKGLCLWRRGR